MREPLIALLLFVAPSAFAAISSADSRAFQIAARQPRLERIMTALQSEAGSVRDPARRAEALKILDAPAFTVIAGRRAVEREIVRRLQELGLLESSFQGPLFPKREPMPFLAAPGGKWMAHHSYPGGLAYHTYFNLKVGLALADSYERVYGIRLSKDWVRLAAIWHDCAKPLTFAWNDDGTLNREEAKIAGTGAHHIWAVAEAAYRGLPKDFLVILASAHGAPSPAGGLDDLLKFLRAAAVIAGKPFEAVGLSAEGVKLGALPPVEAFIHRIDDHDYIFTDLSLPVVASGVDSILGATGDYWKRNEILARDGDVALYPELLRNGQTGLARAVKSSAGK